MSEERNTAKEPTLEEQFQSLEEVVNRLEREEISLEESFQLYYRGMELLKKCFQKLGKIVLFNPLFMLILAEKMFILGQRFMLILI